MQWQRAVVECKMIYGASPPQSGEQMRLCTNKWFQSPCVNLMYETLVSERGGMRMQVQKVCFGSFSKLHRVKCWSRNLQKNVTNRSPMIACIWLLRAACHARKEREIGPKKASGQKLKLSLAHKFVMNAVRVWGNTTFEIQNWRTLLIPPYTSTALCVTA